MIKKKAIIVDYLQLIQLHNSKIESRTQELGYITRELKLLAKSLDTIIIILSQLNRSIENRANKRPLLSDLRESGCIEYKHIPSNYFKIRNNIQYTETLYNSKSFYCTYNSCLTKLKITSIQYTYLITSRNIIAVYVTHNHKILTEDKWKKEDQLKRYNFNSSHIQDNIEKNQFNLIELHPLSSIQLLNKIQVYDIEMDEYGNFLANKQIIHNSIEQDADLVLMLYQEEKNINSKTIDLIISKHRNGPIGSFQLLFHKNICKFKDLQNSTQII